MRTKIINGRIVDGSGSKSFYGDLCITDGKISEIGTDLAGNFDRVIDAAGCVVAPGFIDTHSHSDLKILSDPTVKPKVFQGITTEVFGQDGISMAPLPERYIGDWRKNISGLDGDSDRIDWNYRTAEGYFSLLQKSGLGVNAAYLAPHGNIRMEAMGLDNRAPSPAELEAMKAILRRELEAGAVGLSTGLIYIPCVYAEKQELITLCKVVAEYDGVFVVHQRSEAGSILTSMQEILDIGRESGVRVHFSHFKICGRRNWHFLDEALRMIEQTESEGVRVSFDQYPYTAGSTMLSVILPPWAHDGGTEKLLQRLADASVREELKREILRTDCDWDNFVDFAGLDGIYITSVKHEKSEDAVGKNLVQLGEMRGVSPLDATFGLLVEEENAVGMIDYYGREDELVTIMKRPEQNVCTDGLLGGKPHPRVYGAFPRILGRYVREQGVLTLEQAVHKMTGKSAEVYGFSDRGLLKPDYAADIIIFDPEQICDDNSFTEPERYPLGIRMVMVNGKIAVENGAHTGELPGMVLKGVNRHGI